MRRQTFVAQAILISATIGSLMGCAEGRFSAPGSQPTDQNGIDAGSQKSSKISTSKNIDVDPKGDKPTPDPTPREELPAVLLKVITLTGLGPNNPQYVELVYSKDFAGCVYLEDDQGNKIHTDDRFCESGSHEIEASSIANFEGAFQNMRVGQRFRLCGAGDHSQACSPLVAAENSYIQLHRVRIKNDAVIFNYSKNFPTNAHVYNASREDMFKYPLGFRRGRNLELSVPLSHANDNFVRGVEVYVHHGNGYGAVWDGPKAVE